MQKCRLSTRWKIGKIATSILLVDIFSFLKYRMGVAFGLINIAVSISISRSTSTMELRNLKSAHGSRWENPECYSIRCGLSQQLQLITTLSKRRRLLWCAVFDQSSEFLRPLQLLCVNRATSGEAIKTSPILVTSAAAQLGSVSDEFLFLSIEDILLWESTLANGV